jgi:hypothetical protein
MVKAGLIIVSGLGLGIMGLVGFLVERIVKKSGAEKEFQRHLESLQMKMTGKTAIGPLGVWILETALLTAYTTNPPENIINSLKEEAQTAKKLLKEKIGVDIAVQPVLILDNSKSENKFSLVNHSGVYIIQRRWLAKLIQEFPSGGLDVITSEKIRTALN